MISHEVPNFGTYQYDEDLYEAAMARTVPSLLADVLEQVRGLDKGKVTQARKLRKAELAAMVAEWATGARDNERYHEQEMARQAVAAVGQPTHQDSHDAEQARRVALAAYARYTAKVQVGGREVQGKVVDVVVREPRPGSSMYLMVVHHDGHPTRRTLHEAHDVALIPV